MLTVTNVTKKYGKTTVVKDLSFSLPDNHITILLGHNGAGKSTIIKCIVGFLNYEGAITVDGKPNTNLDVKRQIAYIPEVPELYNELTVSQHFAFLAHAYGVADYQERADYYLDLFKLSHKKDELCGALSKGMRQKVSIICALILKPRVLIVDEPMIGLDPDAIRELKNVFQQLKSECAIFISTHLISSVDNVWDQVLIMKQGELVYSTTKEAFREQSETLEDIYFSHQGDLLEEQAAVKTEELEG